MSLDLYNKVSAKISKTVTQSYSTSFSLGIRFLNKKYREAIYSIYGFVRIADEIVDTFHQYPKEKLLQEFKEQTWKAIKDGISTNPILHSFQRVVNTYKIPKELIEAFFNSMEMDLKIKSHNEETFRNYVYGSAMVVGLMCLKVFYPNDNHKYEKLKYAAMKLGEAFQKVNFLRDIGNDFNHLGRIYFPEIDFNNFSQKDKEIIISSIKRDFKDAYDGIQLLHKDVKLAVLLIYEYYLELLRKIEKTEPKKITETRIRVSNLKKFFITIKACLHYRLKGF
ncbi:MAG: phytoene/squalene synthase family protein [Candidatus Kryptonium sp.]